MGSYKLFDIIGPRMIGPSSSHTAGAARLGNVASRILGNQVRTAEITLYGSFAQTGKGHGTDRAIVGGLLGMKPDDSHIPFAFDEAKERGLKYEIDAVALRDAHPNTAVIELTGADGKQLVMQASSIGGGRIVVNKLDGIDVNFTGNFNTLVIRNQDENGAVAAVTSILSQIRVNVANMTNKSKKDYAYTVVDVDSRIGESVADTIRALDVVLRVRLLNH